MAVKPLRPRWHPRRTHGIHSSPKTLLFRVHWSPPETMTAPSLNATPPSRSAPTQSPLPRLLLHLLYFLTVLYLLPPPSRAQNLDKPLVNIDDDVTAFAYAPDGCIAFSVRRM